jgi:serine/threonine protein kinase
VRDEPSIALVELLARLGLANEQQIRGVALRARRLARGLPLFESVWLDALVQARFISLFQASEIAAGRGDGLRIGPAVLVERLATLGPWSEYRGRAIETGRPLRVLTYCATEELPDGAESALARLVEHSRVLTANPYWAAIEQAGIADDTVWTHSAWQDAEPLSLRLASRGRLPREAAIDVVRQLVLALVELETAGIIHGDLAVHRLLLDSKGQLNLFAPGFRGIVRPSEGFAAATLPAECFDTLAPERIRTGCPPTVASEIYACGAIAWHLLSGRPAFPGANSLAKMRAICAGHQVSLARLVPDLPPEIESTILACLSTNPAQRPATYRELAERLGEPTRSGRRWLARTLAAERRAKRFTLSRRSRRTLPGRLLVAAALLLMAVVASAWGLSARRVTHPKLATTDEPNARTSSGTVAPDNSASEVSPSDNQAPRQIVDDQVAPASYNAALPVDQTSEAVASRELQSKATKPEDVLLLPADRPLRLQKLAPRAGQTVTGPQGARPLVIVPPGGLEISAPNVRFIDVDFLLADNAFSPRDRVDGPRLLRVTSSDVRFERCSFAISKGEDGDDVSAVQWDSPVDGSAPGELLPSGTLMVSECVMYGLGCAIDARREGALRIELSDCLVVDSGPLVRLDRLRRADEPLNLSLARCTCRDIDALVEYAYQSPRSGVGQLAISTSNCVLAPRDDSGLLQLLGTIDPGPILERISWRGAGSILPVDAPLAEWIYDDGPSELIDDGIAVTGLAREPIDFSGLASSGCEASTLATRSGAQQPSSQSSAAPPGIGSIRLPWPRLQSPVARKP